MIGVQHFHAKNKSPSASTQGDEEVTVVDQEDTKASRKSRNKEKSFVELATEVAGAVNLEASPFGKFPHLYRTMETCSGATLVLREGAGQELSEEPSKVLANKIISWLRLKGNPENYLTLQGAKQAVEIWQAIADPISESQIRNVCWSGDPGYTWRRLPWSQPWGIGKTPTWDDLFSRCSNAEAFMAWIGSLLFEESDLQQYVWAYGTGNNGKGSINRFLKRVFGRAYASKQPPNGNKHWTYGLIGKRIVVFPDCNDATFVTQGLFKSMTGGDPIDVDPKYRDTFTIIPTAKYLFLSNERPNLSSEAADLRRIIYCEFDGRKGEKNDPLFEKKLWAEGAAFLFGCMELYKKMAPDNLPIEVNSDGIGDWVETVEAEYAETLDCYFEVKDKAESLEWTRPIELQRYLSMAFKTRRQQLEFISWLERKHGIKKVTDHSRDGEPKVYRGLLSKIQAQVVDAKTGKTTLGIPGRQRDDSTDGRKP